MITRVVFLLALGMAARLLSQPTPIELPPAVEGVSYLPSIPRPEAVLGHAIGTRHTRTDQVVEYFKTLAGLSTRVVVGQHAHSYEGRPLVHAIVTSPANQARLETIRQNNLLLSEAPGEVADDDLETRPVIAYLGYSIHGDEASGTEAALLLLYHLAAGEGIAIDSILDNTVIIIDPMLNPDGRDRFVNWVNGNRGAVATTDPQDREHNQPWPRGRTNHYLFDLNRDWLPAQHPESAGRLQLFHHWRPQLLMDFHEMGQEATYFFQPGIPSRNNPNTPSQVFELNEKMARFHADALDAIGALYYTKESFDDFYYGKGSTYADIHGAVGILCEQASARALKTDTRSGTLDYAFTIHNHFITSLATLQGLVALRKELLDHQRAFYQTAKNEARRNPVKGYLINLEKRRTRAQLLLQTLTKHRVRVYELRKQVNLKGKTFRPGGAVVIPVDQPQTRFLKAVMERVTSFSDSLFYDVSAWTLPLAFGVDYLETKQNPAPLLGAEIGAIELDGGRLEGGRAGYAYLLEWGPYFAPRALYRLLDAGLHPRLTTKPFQAQIVGESRAFPRGTIIIPVVQRDAETELTPEEIHQLIETIVAEDNLPVYSLPTGLTPDGPDLGSRNQAVLEKPVLALLAGAEVNSYQAGEIWHLLSERMGIPVSLIDTDNLSQTDLEPYTTLVMVGGSYSRLDSGAVSKIKHWVQSGGALITTSSAAKWAIQNKLVDEKLLAAPKDTLRVAYEKVPLTRGAQRIGGAIFEARLDTTHPVAFGHPPTVALFRNTTTFYEPSVAAGANLAVYSAEPLLSGYISDRNLERLAGSAAVITRKSGSGSVILFADDPVFRAFWQASAGLLLNAVLFGKAF